MKEFAPYQAPLLTFFSGPFYRDLLKNGKGLGIIYLLVLITLIWSMQTVKIFAVMQAGIMGPEVNEFVAQVPEMKWKQGKLSIDKKSPYIILDDKKKPAIIFDIGGKIKTLADASGAKVLVTEDYLVAKRSSGVEESIPWSKIDDFAITKAMVEEWRGKAVPVCTVFIWLAGLLVWFNHLVLAVIYGLIALIFDKRKLGFPAMMRLAVFAMTPAIVISVVQNLVGFHIPVYPLITVIMTAGFMYFGYQAFEKGEDHVTTPAT